MNLQPTGRELRNYLQRFLVDADTSALRCVDERPAGNPTRGIQIPGATSGLIDALKSTLGLSEDAAWSLARDKGIPFDAHDDDSQGAGGCGYNHLVETDPSSVGAPGAAAAGSRLARVPPQRVLHSIGAHAPAYAAINRVAGKTLDTNAAFAAGAGTFNLDAWALSAFAEALELDSAAQERFAAHILDAYRRAVVVLTEGAISQFDELR